MGMLNPIRLPMEMDRVGRKQADRLFIDFMRVLPERLRQLEQATDLDWVHLSVGHGPDSLGRFASWIASRRLLCVDRHFRSDIVVKHSIPQVRDMLAQAKADEESETHYVFTRWGESAKSDIAMCIGEWVRARAPWTRWVIDGRPKSWYLNKPVVAEVGDRNGERAVGVEDIARIAINRSCRGTACDAGQLARHLRFVMRNLERDIREARPARVSRDAWWRG